MNYEPKLLENKTDKKIEFFSGGKLFIFLPGEKKILEGFDAYHALNMVNTGLTEVGVEQKVNTDLPVDKMSWVQLRQMEDKQGNKIYQMGMSKKKLIEEIKKCLA